MEAEVNELLIILKKHYDFKFPIFTNVLPVSDETFLYIVLGKMGKNIEYIKVYVSLNFYRPRPKSGGG